MDSLTLIDEFIYFNVYDLDTHKLIYSKFNFNFEKYKNDYKTDKIFSSKDKGDVFKHFMNENMKANGFDPLNPEKYWQSRTTVNKNFEKYFLPITDQMIDYNNNYGWIFHDNYMQVKNPIPNVSFTDICKEQFIMRLYTDEEYRRIQDYYYNDKDNNYYTKYNFDFDKYYTDFNVNYLTTNKLVVFTDFIIRCLSLSSTTYGTYGYGLYEPFSKYFNINDPTLMNYLIENSITSDYEFVRKNVTNIDYLQYKEQNADIKASNINSIEELREHYIKWGQFERRIIPLQKKSNTFDESIIKCVGTVHSTDKNGELILGTGFLYNDLNGTDNIYLVTCYHLIIDSPNINTIYASFEVKDNNIIETNATTACFRIIGYDIYADVLVGLYDPKLEYNIVNKVDMNKYDKLVIDFEYVSKASDTIYCLGNLGYENNKSLIQGTIIDPSYSGNFVELCLPIPDSILVELYATKGLSGAPLFIKDTNGAPKCIGMIVGYINDLQQYTVGINGSIFNIIINNITRKWGSLSVRYANDINKLNYYIKNGVTKRWLGIKGSYYNRSLSSKKYSSLLNFPYTGGLVIHDFIIGFNYTKKSFITNVIELSEQSAFEIKTPLVKSQLYKKYIDSGRNPIVIKSITYLNGFISEFSKVYIGKYSNQVSYSRIMYGIAPIGNKLSNPKYVSSFEFFYPNMNIEFYYYNGREWILTSDIVGGNLPENFNTYKDPLGYEYYQHQLEFPFILIPYLNPYMDNYGSPFGKITNSNSVPGRLNSETNSGAISYEYPEL